MTFATILAVIDGAAGSADALETALAAGRRFDARVLLLHPRPEVAKVAPLVTEGIMGGRLAETVDAIEAAADHRAENAQSLYREHCVAPGLPLVGEGGATDGFAVGFEVVTGDQELEVARRGRLADLVVASRPGEDHASPYVVFMETALFETGRPVLLAPLKARPSLGERIALCWSDSRESARALAAALPFLQKARSVQVLCVHDGACRADPMAVERYLAQHGIAARSRLLEPDYRSVGEQMLEVAAAEDADLLVSGAYGHSRLRELVLGGVTRAFIEQGEIPVLMAH